MSVPNIDEGGVNFVHGRTNLETSECSGPANFDLSGGSVGPSRDRREWPGCDAGRLSNDRSGVS
jgi:hypothetical protein